MRPLMATWVILFVAGLLEIAWAIGLKCSGGYPRPIPALVYACVLFSVGLLSVAMRNLPVGTVYAVWTGIGMVGAAFLGIALFGESRDFWRLVFLGIIIFGVFGLAWREMALKDVLPDRTDTKLCAFGCWICRNLC
jgi:quaternary ammonium compound-resistance protein SugE